jgi:hypothetical protein
MRDKEKTAVMQTLELFKLVEFLVQNMPNSKHVLQKYVNHNNTTNGRIVQNKSAFSQRSVDYEIENQDLVDKEADDKNDSDFDVNIDNEEENDENSGTDAESDVEMTSDTNTFTRLKRSPRKSTKTSKTDRYPQRSRKSNKSNAENDSLFAEDSDDSDDETFGKRKKKDSILSYYGRGKRLNRSPVKKVLKERIEASDEESVKTLSPVKSFRNESISDGSQPSTSSAKEVKENQKKTQKRSNESAKEPPKRRKRSAPQETGLLLIDFFQLNKVLKILKFILSLNLN